MLDPRQRNRWSLNRNSIKNNVKLDLLFIYCSVFFSIDNPDYLEMIINNKKENIKFNWIMFSFDAGVEKVLSCHVFFLSVKNLSTCKTDLNKYKLFYTSAISVSGWSFRYQKLKTNPQFGDLEKYLINYPRRQHFQSIFLCAYKRL